MTSNPSVYLPGTPQPPSLFERYLPPVPKGVVTHWLQDNVAAGEWVIDPFGTSPNWAVEAARVGYRLVVAANNPVARFLIEMHAQPPSAEELTAALAELGAAERGDERLEPAILELYMTECPACQAQSPVEAFIWQKDATAPHAKILHCKSCGARGEYETDEKDRAKAAEFRQGGPHLSRALERIAPRGDPDREHAEEALEAYLPRAIYALVAIINRIDGLELNEQRSRLVSALVLSACDRATKLWAHPSGRMRPKQLSAPAQFREFNIWYEMERSIELWARTEGAVPLVIWPQQPPESGGISLFEGRLRDVGEELGKLSVKAAVTAFPRPTQAFWTLCALWAGWLWGREAIGPFALVLRRKRYDWGWHTEALHSGLAALAEQLEESTPLFGVVTESEPGFNAAVITAANLAGFQLIGQSIRREDGQVQLNWRRIDVNLSDGLDAAEKVQKAATGALLERGQPAQFVYLQSASLAALARHEHLGLKSTQPAELFSEARDTIDVGLGLRGGFSRFGGTDQSLETGSWWLLNPEGGRSSLADRTEIAVVRFLLRRTGKTFAELETEMCEIFPGLLTPPRSLLEIILNSYGELEKETWKIAAADEPRGRRADLDQIRQGLAELGTRLGYQVVGEQPVEWHKKRETPVLSFYIIASAVLGEILLGAKTAPEQSVVVLPGRRASLALYKLEHDPRLRQAEEDGWRFLKFRHVRRLAENKSLTQATFNELLELDPLTLENLQAPLL